MHLQGANQTWQTCAHLDLYAMHTTRQEAQSLMPKAQRVYLLGMTGQKQPSLLGVLS